MDELRNRILSARKPAQTQSPSEAAAACGKVPSIAPEGNSSFGIFNYKRVTALRSSPAAEGHRWADGLLRSTAGRKERVILSVRDATRQAEKRGLNPHKDDIYVASSIRKAWNLKPDQLSKGLTQLAAQGAIRITQSQRGRHARFVLVRPAEPEGD